MNVFLVTVDAEKSRVFIRHDALFNSDDCARMVAAFKRRVPELGGRPFTVLVDASAGQTLPPEGRAMIEELQRWAKLRGLRKSAVVITDPVMSWQYRQMVRRSGIDFLERQFRSREAAEAYLDEE